MAPRDFLSMSLNSFEKKDDPVIENPISPNGQVPKAGKSPEKIRLIPDEWHIKHVGNLDDGRLVWRDLQLATGSQGTLDFVCTFIFNTDGILIDHQIDLLGLRGEYHQSKTNEVWNKQGNTLGSITTTEIWVRPFTVEAYDEVFGLLPRIMEDDSGQIVVEFMPGNTMCFYSPWEAGGYDT